MRKLVLWGHHIDEYQEIFGLSSTDFKLRILEYGCGPSALNAELHLTNSHVVSCDPLFVLDKPELSAQATQIFADMVTRVKNDQEKFDFSRYEGLDGLLAKRRAGMADFFSDYELGKKENRYQPLEGDRLPFADFSFDLALSSHYLFAAFDNQTVKSNFQAICELARVAKEVRIFPLIDRNGQPSSFLGPVLLELQQANYGVEVREVYYHLQPKGNAMLRVWAQQCQVS